MQFTALTCVATSIQSTTDSYSCHAPQLPRQCQGNKIILRIQRKYSARKAGAK
jgi:hypothetical protein